MLCGSSFRKSENCYRPMPGECEAAAKARRTDPAHSSGSTVSRLWLNEENPGEKQRRSKLLFQEMSKILSLAQPFYRKENRSHLIEPP